MDEVQCTCTCDGLCSECEEVAEDDGDNLCGHCMNYMCPDECLDEDGTRRETSDV